MLGKPTDKQARYYAAILAGEKAAIAAMKPGVPVSDIFNLAMRVTREAGMPHYQRNHVGHGIGLEPYDPPTINAATNTALETRHGFCGRRRLRASWGGGRSRTRRRHRGRRAPPPRSRQNCRFRLNANVGGMGAISGPM